MALLAGVHPPSWAHQLASGFSQRTGVWATRVRFSMDPETPTADMIQAFWTLAPHEAVKAPDSGRYRGTEKGRVELDFEWNNWFDHTPSTDLHLSSAAFLNSEAAELLAHRASPGAAPFTCRLSDGAGRERTASPPECVAFLSSEGVWTTLLIRAGASGIQFEVQADGAQGRLRAASAPSPREPSQRMMLMLSQHLFGVVRGGVQGVLPRDERVVFDWVYVSPRPDRSLADVLADVATIQAARVAGRRIARLRTTPVRLERPYRPRGGGLERYAPPAVRIEGPQRIAPGQAAEYVARLDDVIGTFRLDWSERPVWPDGHAGDWTVPDAGPAYRYPTRMPRRAACLDLRVDVVTMQYTLVDTDEGRIVKWVPREDGAPLRSLRRVCHRDAPAALRAGAP